MAIKNTKASANSILIDRLWTRAVSPIGVGILILVASLILLVGPMNLMPDSPSVSWWTTALQAEGMARGAAAMLAMVAMLAIGLGVVRHRIAAGDVTAAPPDGGGAGRSNHLAAIGMGLMVCGALVGTLVWIVAGSQVAATKLSLPVGKRVESYPAVTVNGAMRVMLPSRLKVRSLNAIDGNIELELSNVGVEGVVQTVRVGQPVDVDGMRYALMGIEYDPRVVRAVISSDQPNTIATTAVVGEAFRVTVDGREYRVTQMIRDYLNVMGPAIEVEGDEVGKFWLYQRANPIKGFESPDGLKLETLETAPVVILGVSRGQPNQVFGATGVLFLMGLGLFLFGRDRVYGKTRKGAGVWSLNEAHALEQDT